MGQSNTAPRKINKVEGVLGQLMRSMGPGNCEEWVNPSDMGVDYGLSFIGTVTGIAAAPKFQCSGLIGFGNGFFEDYWAYVVWDAGGAAVDPQGQMLECTGYSSATGDFTVAAFAPNVIAVGDKVLLLHPAIAALLNSTFGLAEILADVTGLAGATMRGTNNAALAASWTAALATALTNYTAARAVYLDELAAANLPADVDHVKADTQIRKIQSGVKVINAAVTKYLHIDSGTNGAEILGIVIEGLLAHDWTLDVYIPAADAEGATQAKSKRDTIPFLAATVEGGALKPFGIPFDCYLDFTNDGANDQVDQVTITYRSRAALTLTWEA